MAGRCAIEGVFLTGKKRKGWHFGRTRAICSGSLPNAVFNARSVWQTAGNKPRGCFKTKHVFRISTSTYKNKTAGHAYAYRRLINPKKPNENFNINVFPCKLFCEKQIASYFSSNCQSTTFVTIQ
jgi:hypothetical protein